MVIRSLDRDRTNPVQIQRLAIVLACACLWALVLVGRLAWLQVVIRDELVARADNQYRGVIILPARRGDIFDSRGRILATSVDHGSIYAHPQRVPEPAVAALVLAPALDMTHAALTEKLRSTASFVWLKRKADAEHVAAFREALATTELSDAFGVHEETQRFYPVRSLAAHLIGFVDIDNRGQAGVERSYDSSIRGEDGKLFALRDGSRRLIESAGLTVNDPSRGHDVELTIDSVIQYRAEQALEAAVLSHHARAGSVVVLDPRNGAVLAMASHPTFNPNVRDRDLVDNSRNMAVTYRFEPGSAFKIITASAALHEGVVSEDELVDCEGGTFRVANWTYRDWKPGFGVMPFTNVITNSSNVGTIKVCLRMPPDTYYQWIRDFGFGERTGIDLPAEARGHVPHPDRWSALSQSSMAFGQEISVTPTQLATAVAAIANGGLLLTPFSVAAVRDAGGGVLRAGARRVRRRVLERDIARRMGRVLEEVVANGTGKPAAIPGYRIAGKTSTAQKIDPDTGRYEKYVAAFVGFLPVSDPRAVILVTLDEPTRGYGHHGGQAAGPVFRAIAETVIRVMRLPPDAPPTPPSWARAGGPETDDTTTEVASSPLP